MLSVWQPVRDHLYTIVITSTEYNFLFERAVVGLIRLAIRLLHREDVADQILASLQILLIIKPYMIPKVGGSSHMSYVHTICVVSAGI